MLEKQPDKQLPSVQRQCDLLGLSRSTAYYQRQVDPQRKAFELKLLDLFHRGRATRDNRQDDICSIVRLFYDAVGGHRYYARHPRQVKSICCGLKRSLILKKFPTAGTLRTFLEAQDWR